MKNFFWTLIIIASVSIVGVGQKARPSKPNHVSGGFEPPETAKCSENSDSLYDRQRILEQLAEILNVSVFGTRKDSFALAFKFEVDDERPIRFTVYDLTEPLNKGRPLGKCINLINNHVYHFSPIQKRYSFSHIAILEDGNMKVFRSINCKGKGESLEDVLSYLKGKFKNDKNWSAILNRVKNYRKYGIYTTVDTPRVHCTLQ